MPEKMRREKLGVARPAFRWVTWARMALPSPRSFMALSVELFSRTWRK